MAQHSETHWRVARWNRGHVIERLLPWLLSRDAAYRETRQLERLSPNMRRDLGLPPFEDIRLRDTHLW